ncbi:MAG: cysteine desulfurase family protein, partial [Gemmatimonadota bacterium]
VLGRWRPAGGAVAVSAVEHSAVRRAAAAAAREGAAVTTVAVDEDGRVHADAVVEALAEPHAVVSVMWANNEVGTLQPVGEIAALCRERGAVLHTDAVQAVGHVPVSVRETGVDLLSLSAHKFGGPRGVGALYVREGVELEPLLYGGGQERGLRSGTTNVAGVVGLMTALESAVAELEAERVRLGRLRDQLQDRVLAGVPEARVNGGAADRLPHVLSVGLDGVGPDVLLPALDLAGLAVSAGSACHSGASAPSHVLLAMGREADAALRFSLGWSTTEEEAERAARTFVEVVERVRSAAG